MQFTATTRLTISVIPLKCYLKMNANLNTTPAHFGAEPDLEAGLRLLALIIAKSHIQNLRPKTEDELNKNKRSKGSSTSNDDNRIMSEAQSSDCE